MAVSDLSSPIISALAALAGAGVGGLATYKAAVRGSSLARQAERERWRRERREDAYRAFLTARNRYVEAQIAKGDAMQRWARDRQEAKPAFDWQKHDAPVEDAWAELERQLANVELFGSREARTMVRGWMPALSDFRVGTRPGGAFGSAIRQYRDDEVQQHRDPFIELVRRELDVTD